jgi:hypothetical protein
MFSWVKLKCPLVVEKERINFLKMAHRDEGDKRAILNQTE